MTLKPFRRALALALSLTLAAGVALVAAPAAQAALPNDATLSGLTVSAGTFDAPFDSNSDVISRVTVPNSVSSFAFTPTANDSAATIISYNGQGFASTASGTATTPAFLRVGLNIMTAGVTAPDGTTTRQYTMFVTRQAAPPPADVNLNGLTVSEGTLSPSFDSATTAYTVDVPYTTTSITVTPGSSAAGNTVVVTNGGQEVGEVIRLGIGNNLALVTVTAPDSTSKQYNVIITRGPAPTADVDLAGIQLSNGTLSPAFDPATLRYTATVPYANRTVQITLTASTPGNTLTINNVPVVEGEPATVRLNFNSSNGLGITVTAANGVTKTYIVEITRDQPSQNADLTGLSLSNATLSPAFSNSETAYTATVPYLTTSTVVTSTTADATAILRVNGHDTVSGAASAPVALVVGANTITVTATAEDGVSTTTRALTVTREAPDLDLSALTVTGGTLSPAFDADTTAYTLALPFSVSSVDVAASAVEPDWTLEIDGTETEESTVAVPVGSSTITVTVTAAHGESRQYTVAVARQAASTDADLSGITLSDGTLAPAFLATTTGYTATVDYLTEQITVGASVADATASLTINGKIATSVTSAIVPLVVGENSITLVTTAQDGTTKTTTIVVTRQTAPTPAIVIDLGFKAGDAAANAPFEVTASNLLPGSTATITMHSTPIVLATGTVLADGTIVLKGRIPANAEAGAHRLVFEGIALDGTAATSTAWFTVLRNGTIGAVSLTEPVAYVDPQPAPATPVAPQTVPAAKVGSTALASTGADGGFGAATGASLAIAGALLLMLGGAIRRRRSAA
ncbi:cadherin-like beta sandwich domain-containing protein [Leifsonia sp. YAF41]|uniref:cadherin-like beta sandwich domain-containing protein n=1 Tax=Leifsonia sp. YAF41 TaxID=3233086 RepID=UPI003F9B9991